MSGDFMYNSIWTSHLQIPTFPRLQGGLKTDVLIIGGGLAGILCAHRLAQHGVDYALIEANRICHGVTGNTSAKITSQHGLIYGKLIREFGRESARKYWEINEAAIKEYKQLADTVDCDFEHRDNCIYDVASVKYLYDEMTALEQLGIPAKFIEDQPLPFKTAGGIYFQNQAQFNPMKFVAGIAKGLNIYENTTAKAFDGNTVLTDCGKITASKIIVTTHFPIFNNHGIYFLKMYQQRSYILALKNAPQLNGMYLARTENGLSFRNYGDLLLVGGGGHRTGKNGGGWNALESFVSKHYADAQEFSRWATQDCMTLDGMPYIGQYSKRTSSLYVATGFNKWGMTSSMIAAIILCNLVQNKENPYDDIFSPARSLLRAQLFINGFEAAKNLLKPTKPRCPHMGCSLNWNPQEHSWDCPCHGSRFDKDGRLLDNPANGNLTNK